MTQKTELEKSRRDFLKLAGTGAPLAAVAMATSATTAQAQEPDLRHPSCRTLCTHVRT